MKIHAGRAGGRPVTHRREKGIRPTTSKVRESLFAILGAAVEDSAFLDLFAGSGLVGIEALSRGATPVTFVDLSGRALSAIRESCERLGLEAGARFVRADGLRFLRRSAAGAFDCIFLDPPYASGLLPGALAAIGEAGALTPRGIVIAEHHHKTALPDETAGLALFRREKYGETRLSFFRAQREENASPAVNTFT